MRYIGLRPKKEHPDLDHWQHVRKAALDRDEGCVLCLDKLHLEAHHRTYERYGSELLSDIYIVCRDCHNLITGAQMNLRDLKRSVESIPVKKQLAEHIDYAKIYR